MNNRKISMITSLLLAGVMAMSMTSCSDNKNVSETEESIETAEEKTPESSETALETTAPVIETAAETSALPDTSADDARYISFFENEYPQLSDSLMLEVNGISVLYAYDDLDQDGINELLIGDAEGVYAVVSETDGVYHVTQFNGWRTQYGAVPCEYIGNGCFYSSISNGNNYGGEFSVEVLWRYDASTTEGRGVLARLSGSWDPNNLSENLSKWELYIAADESGNLAENYLDFTSDIPNYSYSMIDYGDNFQFADGERIYNELEQQFYSYVDAHRSENPMSGLEWMPV